MHPRLPHSGTQLSGGIYSRLPPPEAAGCLTWRRPNVQFPGGKPRSCEDLKARYYAVARALAVAREGSEEGAAHSVLVKHPFNAQHERCVPCPARHSLAGTPAASLGHRLTCSLSLTSLRANA